MNINSSALSRSSIRLIFLSEATVRNLFVPNRVGIEHTQGEGPNAYTVATIVKPATVHEEPAAPTAPAAPSSSSDSD